VFKDLKRSIYIYISIENQKIKNQGRSPRRSGFLGDRQWAPYSPAMGLWEHTPVRS